MQITASTPNPDHKNMILTSRIKVLHIISGDLWAGAEAQAFTLINTIKNRCDVTVALMNHGELEQRLKKSGIKTIVINEQLASSITIIRQLTKLIKIVRPDLIHTHRQKENILGSFANLIANKGPFHRMRSVRTVHGAAEHKTAGFKKVITWLDTFCGKYLQDAVISVSMDLHKQLKQIFPESQIHTIQNGVDAKTLHKTIPAEDIHSSTVNCHNVGIIGRLEPVKRVDLFIRAAQQIILQHPHMKTLFHVIGDGKLKEDLVALATELEINDYIIFHGHRNDSIRTIAAMDVVVMCSDHEGTPMTALEVLAVGKPLIAHNVGGLREVLSEHPELLVNHHSADGYSSKIIELLRHPAIPKLKSDYTSDQNATRTLALYKSLLQMSVE